MDKLAAATTCDWIINGIEFTTVYTVPEGSLLVDGIVQNHEWEYVWYFGNQSYESSGLRELVDEDFLEIFWPDWCEKDFGCFCIRLKLDSDGKFKDGSMPDDCVRCYRNFNLYDNSDNVIETHPGTGPTYSCGGTPPEYDTVCTECLEL